MDIIVVPPTGDVSTQSINPDAILEELQEIVGGHIEPLRSAKIKKGYAVISNEEGILRRLPINSRASELIGFTVHGAVAIVREGEEDFEAVGTDVTPSTYQSLCFN